MVQLRNLLWGLLPASDSPSQSSEGDPQDRALKLSLS